MEKSCCVCKEIKPITAFTIRKSGRVGEVIPQCKQCRVEKRKVLRKENPEHFLAIERKSKFKRNYGITLEQYEEMLAKQNGKCAICEASSPSNRTKYFSVDHCHTTGKVRGLLCTKCNRGLGFFNDDDKRLSTAIKYLLGV